jgi:hypothetical protein
LAQLLLRCTLGKLVEAGVGGHPRMPTILLGRPTPAQGGIGDFGDGR